MLWEAGDGKCYIEDEIQMEGKSEGRCDGPGRNGLVAEYSVDAREVEDIQKAVRFADRWGLDLRVKNTGHDQ